ncbi:hypothetical protein LTR62_005643 [Meristemomyces frigidus]|uniref:Uncharacterized protein n=1 Tax=Meristemomyces frigidus TaxID=1508187 RepID=A0AAN7TPG4_9PEZI|nr:hypothetical protein LTR62_005643 [Meristemomyces frigidus]
MAFQAWAFFIFFTSLVALNHRFAQPYDEHKAAQTKRRARTHRRMAKRAEEELREREVMAQKRRERRKEREREEARLEAIRSKQRRWIYGPAQ